MPRPSDIATDRTEPPSADGGVVGLDGARSRIAELEARLAEQARQRMELIHLVCHELRTPITVVGGFGRLLANGSHGALNEQQQHFVEESLKACARLDAFVEDLLEARPGSATPFPVVPEPADLHDVLEAPLEALMPRLEEHGIKVEMLLRASHSTFAFDARRIEQVVTNLLTNAIRHGRASGVVRIETVDIELEGDRAIQVSVEDDGPGIPPEDRERLFAPYVRGVDTDAVRGLGIGLALCRRIVEAHAGRLHVEEGELSGARFVFGLPLDASRALGVAGEN